MLRARRILQAEQWSPHTVDRDDTQISALVFSAPNLIRFPQLELIPSRLSFTSGTLVLPAGLYNRVPFIRLRDLIFVIPSTNFGPKLPIFQKRKGIARGSGSEALGNSSYPSSSSHENGNIKPALAISNVLLH